LHETPDSSEQLLTKSTVLSILLYISSQFSYHYLMLNLHSINVSLSPPLHSNKAVKKVSY
jgi:hypothetical protein